MVCPIAMCGREHCAFSNSHRYHIAVHLLATDIMYIYTHTYIYIHIYVYIFCLSLLSICHSTSCSKGPGLALDGWSVLLRILQRGVELYPANYAGVGRKRKMRSRQTPDTTDDTHCPAISDTGRLMLLKVGKVALGHCQTVRCRRAG